jgi:hypothetical protein
MSNKTILLVGVLDIKGSTNISMAKSLTTLGYEVIPINYRTIINKYGHEYFEKYLLSVSKKYSPFLTIFSKCNGFNTEVIKNNSFLGKTWLFNMDPKQTIERCPEVVQHAIYCDYSSCTALDMVDWFKSQGAYNCCHIVQGVDTDIFRPVEPIEKYKADISFIGTKTPEREVYINFLIKNGFDVKTYGNGYSDNAVVNDEFAQICSSSKFMLSMNTINNVHTGYFSNRLPRYLACGSCTYHLDTLRSIGEYFEDGEEIVYFQNKEDLLEKLEIISEVERKKIGEKGRQKVIDTMTWDIKMKELLDIVENNK